MKRDEASPGSLYATDRWTSTDRVILDNLSHGVRTPPAIYLLNVRHRMPFHSSTVNAHLS